MHTGTVPVELETMKSTRGDSRMNSKYTIDSGQTRPTDTTADERVKAPIAQLHLWLEHTVPVGSGALFLL
jgi:hypothetical protein